MTGERIDSSQTNEAKRLGIGKQIVVTLGILLAAGCVLGAIWLLDTIAH